jgi:hypothetical protein
MNPVDQSRRRRVRRIDGRVGRWIATAALLFLAGCEGLNGKKFSEHDPFLGSSTPPNPTPVAGPGIRPEQSTATSTTNGSIPPLPSSMSAPGTAALASGETGTPEPARDMRLTGGAARGVAPNVSMGSPEPAATGTTSRMTATSGATTPPATFSGSAASVRSFEDAQQFLKRQHVAWQRLDMEDDGSWTYTCSVPLPSNPHTNRTYKTTQTFSDPLAAIRAVLTQIEQNSR